MLEHFIMQCEPTCLKQPLHIYHMPIRALERGFWDNCLKLSGLPKSVVPQGALTNNPNMASSRIPHTCKNLMEGFAGC